MRVMIMGMDPRTLTSSLVLPSGTVIPFPPHKRDSVEVLLKASPEELVMCLAEVGGSSVPSLLGGPLGSMLFAFGSMFFSDTVDVDSSRFPEYRIATVADRRRDVLELLTYLLENREVS